jgi:hypothetical protein
MGKGGSFVRGLFKSCQWFLQDEEEGQLILVLVP